MPENTNKADEQTTDLSSMTDEDIIALVNKYNELDKQEIFDPANLDDLSHDDLTNLAVGMDYLTNSGLINAELVFPDLYIKVNNELQNRFGIAPLTSPATLPGEPNLPDGVATNPVSADELEVVSPDDYTDVADGDTQPITDSDDQEPELL